MKRLGKSKDKLAKKGIIRSKEKRGREESMKELDEMIANDRKRGAQLFERAP